MKVAGYPQQDALGPWRAQEGYADESWPLERMRSRQIEYQGGSGQLYPTHPDQFLKLYHRYDQARYNARQLDGRSELCVVSPIHTMRPSAAESFIQRMDDRDRLVPCARGDAWVRYTLSDTYMDERGNFYRGIASDEFLQQYESMGHSVSPGRRVLSDGREAAEGVHYMYMGDTYAVPVTGFDFLAQPLPNDRANIQRYQERALSTHRRDGLLWRHIGD